ncbi:hypothetical protein [Marinobacter sp. F4216]|uniref:hypothetical protein n=1 Tax=Marinobacter sp. F4216 TaxID=2874281 RepID=UPI001CC17A67|nr:hypothetical protein [Marinobacter sp. F4216]MBZ2168103.1 hypothetical protein [Marinobacter sp. F4216]
MNRKPNESSKSQEQGSEKVAQDRPVTDKPDAENRRENSEEPGEPGEPGEKDGSVLGKIND